MRRGTPRLGQHFLNNPTVADTLIEAAAITEGSRVLEIGPGTGALTRKLLATGASVTAIERDATLVTQLHETFSGEISAGKLLLVEDDIRNIDASTLGYRGGDYILAANIPYYITGEIIRTFLTASAQPMTMCLLIQREVAQRIVAKNNKESLLSLSVKAYGTPLYIRTVTRGNFTPPPAVDSAILAIKGISRNFFVEMNEETFFEMLHAGFGSKRKLLIRNLEKIASIDELRVAFTTSKISPQSRAEDLSLEEWGLLTRTIQNRL